MTDAADRSEGLTHLCWTDMLAARGPHGKTDYTGGGQEHRGGGSGPARMCGMGVEMAVMQSARRHRTRVVRTPAGVVLVILVVKSDKMLSLGTDHCCYDSWPL